MARWGLAVACLGWLAWAGLAGAQQEVYRRFYFGGELGGRAAQLELLLEGEELVTGHALASGEAGRLRLEGRLSGDGRLLLSDDLGGAWSARIAPEPGLEAARLLGVRLVSGRRERFDFEKLAEYVSFRLQQGDIRAESSYPFFTEPALRPLNGQLQTDLLGEQLAFFEEAQTRRSLGLGSPWRYRNDTSVRYASSELVSALSRLESSRGGATEVSFWSYNLARVGGRLQLLSLDDLFRRGAAYAPALEAALTDGLLSRGTPWAADPELLRAALGDLENFVVDPSGLTFLLQPPGWDGRSTVSVTVPYAELRPYLNRNGPLAPLLR